MSGKVGDALREALQANQKVRYWPVAIEAAAKVADAQDAHYNGDDAFQLGFDTACVTIAARIRALSASPQDGWVLVPRQPTREMILAAWNAKEESGRAGFGKASWDAMLDALPQPTGDGT